MLGTCYSHLHPHLLFCVWSLTSIIGINVNYYMDVQGIVAALCLLIDIGTTTLVALTQGPEPAVAVGIGMTIMYGMVAIGVTCLIEDELEKKQRPSTS